MPRGWFPWGEAPDDYEMGTDGQVSHSGRRSGYIKSRDRPRGFGSLTQSIKADRYRSKRVKLTGYARSDQVQGWAGFWMRIDGPKEPNLAFDSMQRFARSRERPGGPNIRLFWTRLAKASEISFGVLLSGQGQVWIDDVELDIAEDAVPTTEFRKQIPDQPVNLDFEEPTI